jgi:hypothetical protein
MLACGGSVGGWENEAVPPGLETWGERVFENVGYCIGVDVTAEPLASEWAITGGVWGVWER